VRQVDLGLDFFFAAQRAGGAYRLCLPLGRAAEMNAHFFRFVLFERTGMRLLLGHSHQRKRIENGFAFDFQFSGKIVDSNLTHPAFLFPALCLSLHRSLTESVFAHAIFLFC
jgi:hypothetical protein